MTTSNGICVYADVCFAAPAMSVAAATRGKGLTGSAIRSDAKPF